MAWTTPQTYAVGQLLTAADMNTFQRDNFDATLPYGVTTQTYTPSLQAATTNPTLGSGSTQQGAYYRTGRWVFVHFFIRFGTSGTAAGSGGYFVSLPVSANTTNLTSSTTARTGSPVGSGIIHDDSAPAATQTSVLTLRDASTAGIQPATGGTPVSDSNPWVWAASDLISGVVKYPAA